jgi:ABC-2 type transport system permease protein
VWLGASLEHLSIDAARVAAASLSIWPLELVTAAAVFLLAGFLRAGAVAGTVGALMAISYVLALLHPLLTLPGWLLDLSVFYHYGSPLLRGMAWASVAGMLATVLLMLACATAFWQRADLAGRALRRP